MLYNKFEYKNSIGVLHRRGGLPAIERENGTKEWWVNGKLHRRGGLPAIDCVNGSKEWWVNGKRHRDGGLPAIEWRRIDLSLYIHIDRMWYVNGYHHREGGLPAIEWYNGQKVWFVNGNILSEEKGLAYFAFCERMQEKKRIRAQKKIYFWWIQICYDLTRPCGLRMANINLNSFKELMCQQP